jgi:hypothetical protein
MTGLHELEEAALELGNRRGDEAREVVAPVRLSRGARRRERPVFASRRVPQAKSLSYVKPLSSKAAAPW